MSDELLRQMAAAPSAWVQAHAAMNPVCPSDIQATLAADPVSELVRSASAGTMRRRDRALWEPT